MRGGIRSIIRAGLFLIFVVAATGCSPFKIVPAGTWVAENGCEPGVLITNECCDDMVIVGAPANPLKPEFDFVLPLGSEVFIPAFPFEIQAIPGFLMPTGEIFCGFELADDFALLPGYIAPTLESHLLEVPTDGLPCDVTVTTEVCTPPAP
jgi:hypothetical protein